MPSTFSWVVPVQDGALLYKPASIIQGLVEVLGLSIVRVAVSMPVS